MIFIEVRECNGYRRRKFLSGEIKNKQTNKKNNIEK